MKTKKTTTVCAIILFTLSLFIYIPHTAAVDTSTLNLPIGAKARLGKGSISGLAISPDRTRFAVASSVGIWIHDTDTGEELSLFTGLGLLGKGLEIDSIVFSSDGKTIASGNSDGSVMLWDAETGLVQRTYQKHTVGESVTHVAFGPDGKVLASTSANGNLHIYDVTTGVVLRSESPVSNGQKISFTSIAFSHDGKRLAGSSSDGAIFLWNLDEHAQIPAPVVTGPYLFGIRSSVFTVTFSPDGKTLASGSVAGIHFWDAKTGIHLHTFTEHWAKNTSSFAFSSDGKTLVSANTQFISVSDVETRTNRDIRLNSLFNRTIGFYDSLILTPDESILANYKDKINLYDFNELTLHYSVTGFEAVRREYDVAFRPTDGKIVANSGSKGIYLWDAETGAFLKLLSTGIGSGRDAYRGPQIAFSPDGKTLAACKGSRIDLWNVEDVETATLRRTLTGPPSNYNLAVAFSPDGKTLASGASSYTYGTGNSYTIQLWSLEEGTIRHTLTGVSHVFDLAFSPDGKTLASGGVRNTILLWDVENVEDVETVPIRHTLTETGGQVQSIAFSTDGKTVAGASGGVYLWDVKTGRKLKSLYKGQETGVPYQYDGYIAAFSPDGRTFLAVGKRGITLWNMEENALGRKVPVDIRNRLPTNAFQVAFSPDKRTLASTSEAGVVMLWNTPSEPVEEKEIFRNTHMLHGHTERVRDIAFSPNGKILASGGDDKIIRLWDIGRNTVLRSLKGHWHHILGLTFSQDGNTLVSWDYDTIRVWDVFPGTQRYMLPADLYAYRHNYFYRSVALSPNGRTLACASGESGKSIFLWDVLTGTLRHTLEHTREVKYLKFSPDGHTLQTISWNDVNEEPTHLFWDVVIGTLTSSQDNFFNDPDRQIRINQSFYWSLGGNIHYMEFIDKETNAVVRRLPMEDPVRIIGFRSDNKILLTAKADANNQLASWYGASGTLVIYDVEKGTPLQTVEEVKNHTVFLSPYGETIATTYENTVWLWDIDREPSDDITDTHGDVIVNITDDSDTTYQPEVKTEADYRFIDLNTKVDVMRYWTNSTVLSPDGKTLASFADNTINLWYTETSLRRDTITVEQEYEFRDNFRGAVFDPDSKTLATAVDKTVLLWDMETLAIRQKFTGHINITSMAYSPDGTTLAIGGPDEIILWDIARNTHIIGQGSFIPRDITFSPNGKTLAIVSGGGSVLFLDVKRGILNGELNIASYPRRANNPRGRDQSLVRASRVVFSPDGKTLIVQHDYSPNVSFWHVETGISLHFIEQNYLLYNDISTTQLVGRGRNRPAYSITSFAVSPDGKTLALGQSRKGIQVWDLNSGTLRYAITSVSQAATQSSDTRVGAIELAFTPDGELVSVDVDHIVRIWDIAPKLGSSLINTGATPPAAPRPVVHVIWYYPYDEGRYTSTNSNWVVNSDTIDAIMEDVQDFFALQVGNTFDFNIYNIESTFVQGDLLTFVKDDKQVERVFRDVGAKLVLLHNMTHPDKTQDYYLVVVQSDSPSILSHSPGSYVRGLATGRFSIVSTGNYGYGVGGLNIAKEEVKTHDSMAGLIAHELGHNFRLSHTPDAGLIMGYERVENDLWQNHFTPPQRWWLRRVFDNPMPVVGQNVLFSVSLQPDHALKIEVATPGSNVADSVSQLVVESLPNVDPLWVADEMWEGSTSDTIYYSNWGNPRVQIKTIDINGHITSSIHELFDLLKMAADLDGNGAVDILDLRIVVLNYGKRGQSPADVNRNGVVDITDLMLVVSVWNTTTTTPAPAASTQVQSYFTASQLQGWLAEARASGNTSVTYQQGIAFLEQLLALFTPEKTALLANYPNPFNPETWIPYQLATPADVSISIYATDGTLVRTLDLGHQAVGMYQGKSRAAHWDGKNALGESVASGVYFYTLTAGDFTATRKMLIVK